MSHQDHDELPAGEGRVELPWGFLAFLLLASLALAAGLASELDLKKTTDGQRARAVLGLAPPFAALLALFHPAVPRSLRALGHHRVAWIAAALVAWTYLVPASRFDPYWTVLVALWAAVPLLALRVDPDPGRLTPVVLLVWLVWWIPFDLRWYGALWTGPGVAYHANSLLVSLLACAAFGALSRSGAPALELRWPNLRDLYVGLGTLLVFGAIAVPIGVAVGFLHPGWPPKEGLSGTVLLAFGIAFTVALPEELYFRGVLDAGMRPLFRRAWTSLLISSIAFGLMHWNNRAPDKLNELVAYFFLASVAGVFYGLAYRLSGLWAAVLAHTLVDVAWQLVLRAGK